MLTAALFKPFTAPAADSYLRILTDLYTESRRAPAPLSRDLALDIIIQHTRASHSADNPLPAALETLNYLQECGWLRLDVQPDFTQACLLTPRAFQFLQLFNPDRPSISQLLITIYDLLKAALFDVDNADRLAEATRLTDQLIDSLKAIQHNADLSDPLPDTARLRAAVLDAAVKLEARGHPPARYIRDQFAAFDRLLADLGARRARLATVDRQPSALAPHLAAILARVAALNQKSLAKHTDALINLYSQSAGQLQTSNPSASLREASLWDSTSLKPQTSNSLVESPISPQHAAVRVINYQLPITNYQLPITNYSSEDIASARRAVAHQLNRPISPDRVRRLAQTFLQGKPEVRVSDLVTLGQADLPLVVQLRLHGASALGYTIEDMQWVEINGLVFRDFVLKNPNYIPSSVEPEPASTDSQIIGLSDEQRSDE